MPGQIPTIPEPSAYLVEVPQTAGPQGFDQPSLQPRIEAFPMVDGVATPQWVELPERRIVESDGLFAFPVGARKLPLYDPTGAPEFRPVRTATTQGNQFLFVSEGFGADGQEQFFSACENVAAKLLDTPPFRQESSRIQIDGLFLPLSGGAVIDIGCSRAPHDLARLRPTLFGAQSCLSPTTPELWGGDEDRVRKTGWRYPR